jgi:hypothetical protein
MATMPGSRFHLTAQSVPDESNYGAEFLLHLGHHPVGRGLEDTHFPDEPRINPSHSGRACVTNPVTGLCRRGLRLRRPAMGPLLVP